MPASLADQYARSIEFQRKIDQRIKRLKAKIDIQLAKTGNSVSYGSNFNVEFSTTTAKSLDQDKVRVILTQEQIISCEKTSTRRYYTVRKTEAGQGKGSNENVLPMSLPVANKARKVAKAA